MQSSEIEFILNNPIFTTRIYANEMNSSISSASRILNKKNKKNEIMRITSGVWAIPKHSRFNYYSVTPFLLDNETGYISFLTALHLHGILSQIPASIQIATTGHSRKLKTAIGVYEFFQMKPSLMRDGIEWQDNQNYRIASPEKAFFDTLYISARKGKRFYSLPELDLNKKLFNKNTFLKILKQSYLLSSIKICIQNKFNYLCDCRKIS